MANETQRIPLMTFAPIKTGVLILALASLPVAASAQDDDPLVATVNGKEIHRSEVLEAARSLPAQYQSQLQQLFPMLVERVVDFHLLSEAAGKAGFAKDKEVKRRLAKLQEDVIREVYIQRQIDKRVNDAAVRKRYDEFLAGNPAKPEVHARHILVEDEATAKELIKKLDGGADFAELAKESSTGPSASRGGDLGYFTADQMVPEFSEQAFKLEDGQYSKAPVKTQFGWHVIKVEDRRESAPPAFEGMEQQLREELSREAVGTVLSDLREGAKVAIVSPLPAAFPEGHAPMMPPGGLPPGHAQ
jgi:peptidyl-prolyl cis-trans isomerase C